MLLPGATNRWCASIATKTKKKINFSCQMGTME